MPNLHPQTGPVTAAGKKISSRNATTHGGTSEKLIVAGERREDFDALLDGLLEEYAPVTDGARCLVEDATLARWFLWRKQRAYNAIEASVYAAEPNQEKWSAEAYHQLALADRYKTSGERALKRALHSLDGLRKQYRHESERFTRERQWEAAHQLDCRRLDLQEKRFDLTAKREARIAKKEEVAAELAIARATDSLEERKREQWKAACNGFDVPTLVQKINVRVTSGGTVTEMSPSNQALLREADRALHPPEQVYRDFYFPQGMPPEYDTFPGGEGYRHEKRHTIEHMVPIDTWREMVAEESDLDTGHAVPGPDAEETF
jgi:hypothetical protein